MEYTVSSSRILRTAQGQSRGVGFARYMCLGLDVEPLLMIGEQLRIS